MTNVSCVDQLSSVKLAPNVPNVAQNLPVETLLNQFWKTWEALVAWPRVVQMLKDGYTLPFQTRPNLTRSPTIISCYVHPYRNLCLLEALYQLTNKNAVELVKNQESLGFYNRTDKHRNKSLASQLENNWVVLTTREREVVDSLTSSPHVRPGVSSHINDNYYVSALRLLTRGKGTVNYVRKCQPHWTGLDHNKNRRTVNSSQCYQAGPVSRQTVNCFQSVVNANSVVVNYAHIVQGQPQRKA